MPLYEYACPHCQYQVEVRHSILEKLVYCPHCGQEWERLISRSSFILKGSGWHATDYSSSYQAGKQEFENTRQEPEIIFKQD